MIDAKPIPESDKILATFSPGHGITDHLGYVTIVSPKGGPDDLDMVTSLSDRTPLVKDPYPLSENAFLVARGKEIHLMDVQGNTQTLYTWPGEGEVYEPRAIRPRRREPVIVPRVDWQQPTGSLILANVYHGRHLEGVQPGEINGCSSWRICPSRSASAMIRTLSPGWGRSHSNASWGRCPCTRTDRLASRCPPGVRSSSWPWTRMISRSSGCTVSPV
jgi:hypothetical protein